MAAVEFSHFDTKLGIVYSEKASALFRQDYWIVKKGFTYLIGGDLNKRIEVPKGYLTDGATVPRLFWSLVPPWGAYGQATVLHDWLCEYMGYYDNGFWTKINRKEVDEIFNQAMKDLGVKSSTRSLMYNAVKLYRKVTGNNDSIYSQRKHDLELELLQHYEMYKVWL